MRVVLHHDHAVSAEAVEGLTTGFLQEGHAARVVAGGWLRCHLAARAFKPDLWVDYQADGTPWPRHDMGQAMAHGVVRDEGAADAAYVIAGAVWGERILPPPFAPMRDPETVVVAIAGAWVPADSDAPVIRLDQADRARVADLLMGCDIAVFPASAPRIWVAHAMAASCAILAVGAGGLLDDRNAMLVANDAALDAGIRVLRADAALRARLGAAARADCAARDLTWRGHARRIVARFAAPDGTVEPTRKPG